MLQIVIRIPERTFPIERETIEIALFRCKLESCQMPIDHEGFCSKQHNDAFHNLQKKMRNSSGASASRNLR